MRLQPIIRQGTTPSRKRFWDDVYDVLVASQKIAGRNITAEEHPGEGTVINAIRPVTAADCGGCVCIDTVEIETAGSGYRIGERLAPGFGTICPPGGDFPFQLLVAGVDGSGAVTDFVIIPGIGYSAPPSNPIAFGASVLGTGFTANCTFACTSGTNPRPASIQFEFHDVVFDCGCIDNNNGTSRIVEAGNFSETLASPFTKTSECGGAAVWRDLGVPDTCDTSEFPSVLVTYWEDNDSCSGDPDPSEPFLVEAGCHAIFFLRGGIYRLIVLELTGLTAERPSLVFDGTTTDLSLPIANTVTCGTGICGGGVAHGGTATVNVL